MNEKVKDILEWIYCIVIAVILALLFRYYIGTPTIVQQVSMKPTLIEGQRLWLNRWVRTTKKMPEKGDIITLVETTELLNGEFTVRTYKLRVDRVNKKTVSMTNLTSDFTFKLADITNEFCYSVKREYFYTEEYDEPKEDKIKVVVKKPGDTHGQIVEIDNRLEELQSIVEGYIEVFPLTEDILIILNEEGKLQDLKPNIFVSNGEGFELIVGNIRPSPA